MCNTQPSCTLVRAPMRMRCMSPRITVSGQTELSAPISTSPFRSERPCMSDVQHAAVLHAGARTDADAVHVAANHRQRPNRAVGADFDIADHHRRNIDKSPGAHGWRVVLIGAKGHDSLSLFC